jgi:anti-sigma B factor antagonist
MNEGASMPERLGVARPEAGAARTWRIDLHGDLDLQSAPALSEQLEELAAEQAVLVIVNLENVSFLDSSGLRALVHGARSLEDAGGRLLVQGASGAVARVLELTDLLRRLSDGEE